MAITARRLTIEDLEIIPEEREGDRHELIDGELFVTPVPIVKHQIISMNLIRHLDRHVYGVNLGMVFTAPTGVRLAPDTLVIPDICFVSRDRLPDPDAKTIDAAPDLVVEILLPGTRRRDLEIKRALYARYGVPEYWIIDPDARTILVLTLTGDRFEPIPLTVDGIVQSHVLPDLVLTSEQIFADLP